jgi:hypothetical protein
MQNNVVNFSDYYKATGKRTLNTNESYIINTIMVPRNKGESLARVDADASLLVQLNGYAIVPIEQYCELKGIPMQPSILEDIERTQKRIDCNAL